MEQILLFQDILYMSYLKAPEGFVLCGFSTTHTLGSASISV